MSRSRNDGFTEPMRQWILERDNKTCQLCGENAEGTRFEIHHITPWRYAMTVLHWTLERTNLPTNGITLCKMCHRGDSNSIHPDIARASKLYHEDKRIYDRVFAKRDEMCRHSVPYWNTSFDSQLAVKAVMNTMHFIAEGNYPTPWQKEST